MSCRRVCICTAFSLVYIILIVYVNFRSFSIDFFEEDIASLRTTHSHQASINAIIWTYDGTGLMKYIQWILTRKLGNIRITQFDDHFCIRKQDSFTFNSTNQSLIQIYIVSLTADLKNQSRCKQAVDRIIRDNKTHIYFKRKSVAATVVFHELDSRKPSSTLNISLIEAKIRKTADINKYISKHFINKASIRWKIIDSEELVHADLVQCEASLLDFISLFKFNIADSLLASIIEYDSHRFIKDAVWWDRSDVAERVLNMSIPPRSSNLTYEDDFYYLHGRRSFIEYLVDNRQCFTRGTFAQLQSETRPNRMSTDNIDRCSLNEFDCAFSDIYSFEDREKLYVQANYESIKCAFTIPSIFDIVRKRYARNHTCETIVFTSIIRCYDPLPRLEGKSPSSFCYVAIVDAQTYKALKYHTPHYTTARWDLVNVGEKAALFASPAKTVETLKTLGQRMFPLAKWIVWMDGKAHLINIADILRKSGVSILSARHSERDRTSAIEVRYTIERIRDREGSVSLRFNQTVSDIKRQEAEYQRDGFYSRSDAMNLRMYDIAMFMYRNNHPCNFRYLCGWHNEINYFAYRGQLSVYYAAVRMNITDHFGIIPRSHYHTYAHLGICRAI
ncbi:unnamed protein product [Adineta ricciae]|uniref:TOD1/MUCI70 glycosyltransferase-like domain-containing protein n=1 Tax=Adineta ricciae TaxID=249248 RepID=A0A814AJZ7_ADIRI|nr:unnamed protein product [Adineta ricciae]CAF1009722.1 unnamed protein product [Adineta ricciae]